MSIGTKLETIPENISLIRVANMRYKNEEIAMSTPNHTVYTDDQSLSNSYTYLPTVK